MRQHCQSTGHLLPETTALPPSKQARTGKCKQTPGSVLSASLSQAPKSHSEKPTSAAQALETLDGSHEVRDYQIRQATGGVSRPSQRRENKPRRPGTRRALESASSQSLSQQQTSIAQPVPVSGAMTGSNGPSELSAILERIALVTESSEWAQPSQNLSIPIPGPWTTEASEMQSSHNFLEHTTVEDLESFHNHALGKGPETHFTAATTLNIPSSVPANRGQSAERIGEEVVGSRGYSATMHGPLDIPVPTLYRSTQHHAMSEDPVPRNAIAGEHNQKPWTVLNPIDYQQTWNALCAAVHPYEKLSQAGYRLTECTSSFLRQFRICKNCGCACHFRELRTKVLTMYSPSEEQQFKEEMLVP